MNTLGFLEWLVIQLAIYTIIWSISDYMGSLLSTSFFLIAFGVLVISIIAEWIEPTKIAKGYFEFMAASVVAPLVITLVFLFLFEGQLNWMGK